MVGLADGEGLGELEAEVLADGLTGGPVEGLGEAEGETEREVLALGLADPDGDTD